MSSDITSLTTPDKQFDYMLTLITKLESKLNEKMDNNLSVNDSKVNELEGKLASLSTKFEDIQTKFVAHKLKADKIDDFSLFITKAKDQLISHDIKLKNTTSELSEFQYKFDKLFVSNLTVPAFIGEQCQFKTLREYLEYNIKELGSLVTFRDKTNLDVKQYKEKMEGLIKEFERQTKTFSLIQNNHFEELNKEINIQIGDLRKEFFAKLDEQSMENSKYAVELKNKTEGIQFEWDNMKTFKQDLNAKFNETIIRIKDDNDKAVLMVSGYKKEFQKMKEKLADLIEFIKDVRFRRNLVAFDVVQKKDVKNLNERMLFKDKSKDDHYSYTRHMDLKYELFADMDYKDYILNNEPQIPTKKIKKDKPNDKSIEKEHRKEVENPTSTKNKEAKQITTITPQIEREQNRDQKKTNGTPLPQLTTTKPIIISQSLSKKFSSSDNVPTVTFNKSSAKRTNPLTQNQSTSKPVDSKIATLQIFNETSNKFKNQETFEACIQPFSGVPKREGKRFRTTMENTQEIKNLFTKSTVPHSNMKSPIISSNVKTKDAIDCSPKTKKPEKVDKVLLSNMNRGTEDDIEKTIEQFKLNK